MRAIMVHFAMLCCLAGLPSAAIAETAAQKPVYIGKRSANPEQETFGFLSRAAWWGHIGFPGAGPNISACGPAMKEKDTFAYEPIVIEVEKTAAIASVH